jgi:SAM-dependent methyltransferase
LNNPVVTHLEKVGRWIVAPGKIGVEIGAFKWPVPGIKPFYVDCFTSFGHEDVTADYYGHACFLPFRDNSLDYVVNCHVLEHVANPVAALAEWYRVLRPGGIIYMVVPDRRFTFDRPRALTTVEHMMEDHARGTTPCDDTHIDDFVRGVDWAEFNPATPAAEVAASQDQLARGMHEAVARGDQVNIHFHVFEPANVLGLIERLRSSRRFNWEVVDQAERFPTGANNGFLVILRVRKTWRDFFAGLWHRWLTSTNPRHPVRADAEPFADFAKNCQGIGGVR